MKSTVARRIAALADAALRWRDADFAPRVRTTRAICDRTGYTEPVVDFALDALFGEIDETALRATIVSELGSLDALDGFVERPGRPSVFFRALARTTIVSSDTTIGVAIPTLAFAICAGCDVVVKDRDDRLVAAFVASVVEELPELADRITTGVWDGGSDEAATSAHIADADVVIAYGANAALAAIRSQVRADARFVGYGHRTSVGYVARETLASAIATRDAAHGLARDALLYDGDGCLSLHAVFVETNGALSARDFARHLGDACETTALEFPAAFTERDRAVVAYERAARFREAQGLGAVLAGVASPHLLVFDPPITDVPPLLRRTVAVYGVAGPAEATAFLHAHRVPLEGVALDAHSRDDVVTFARECGAARIAAFGTLQRPPLGGDHGGHPRMLPFVRSVYRG